MIGCAVSPTTRDQLAPLLRPKTSPVAAGCIFEVLVLPLSHMICDKELSSLNAWLSCVRPIPKSKVCPASLWLGGHGLRLRAHFILSECTKRQLPFLPHPSLRMDGAVDPQSATLAPDPPLTRHRRARDCSHLRQRDLTVSSSLAAAHCGRPAANGAYTP